MTERPQDVWTDDFGEAYTDRTAKTVEEMDEVFENRFGITRTDLNQSFLSDLEKDIRVLEVGTNIGTQLMCLRELGFENLYGIEIQRKAIEKAHRDRSELDIIEGDALDIPFKDDYFDLVFTSSLLIHIPPPRLKEALHEIARCSNQYIFGYEYYAEEYTEITYRGKENILWKTDFPAKYHEHTDVEVLKERKLEYAESENVDVMFLLEQSER